MVDDYKELLERFIYERKRTKVSQDKVSTNGGLSKYTVSRMETGESIPRTDTFVKMCKGMGMMIVLIPIPSILIAEKVIIKAIEDKEKADREAEYKENVAIAERRLEEKKRFDYDNWDYDEEEGEL